jgi:outer membrane autotransporter protein
LSNASVTITTVNSGAVQSVGSTASATFTTLSGGTQTVSGGGARSTIIYSTGIETVLAGGIASATIVNSGGQLNVSSGGSSYYTIVNNGGIEYISTGGYGPSSFISSGGSQIIASGGLDSGTTVYTGGTQTVSGVAVGVALSGGTQNIISGGTGSLGVLYDSATVSAATGSYLLGYALSGNSSLVNATGVLSGASAGGNSLAIGGNSNTVLLTGANILGGISGTGSNNSVTISAGNLGANITMGGSANIVTLDSVALASSLTLADTSSANTLQLQNQSMTIGAAVAGQTAVTNWNRIFVTSNTTLSLNGNLPLGGTNSILSMDSSSVLQTTAPSVTITANTFSNAGAVKVGAGQTLGLTGNYTQTGTYSLSVLSPTSYGKFNVTGTGSLNGTQLQLDPSSVLTFGTRYKAVFSALGGLTGTLIGGTYMGMKYTIAPESGNANILDLIAGNLNNSTPVLNGSQSTAVLNQMFSTVNIIRDRMSKLDSAAYYGTSYDNKSWITPFASWGNQASNNNAPSAGYKQNTGGVAFGIDSRVTSEWRTGLAGIIQNTSFSGTNTATADSVSIRSYQVAAYARHSTESGQEINLIANVGDDLSNTSRVDQTSNQTAKASFAGKQAFLSAEYGQKFVLNDQKIQPFVRMDYGFAGFGNYTETGAGTGNLTVNAQNSSSLVSSVGGKYQFDFTSTSKLLTHLSVGYDSLAKPAQLQAADAQGVSFMTTGPKQSNLLYEAGLGYQADLQNGMKVRFNYDYIGRSGFSNNMGSLNLIIPLGKDK